MVRTNLIKNPSFEVDLTGYLAETSTTLSRDTTEFWSGTASMKCVSTAINKIGLYGRTVGNAANASSIPVSATQQVTVSAYVKATTSGVNHRVEISWFRANGSYITASNGSTVAVGTSWTRLSVTATAPTDATHFGMALYKSSAGSHTSFTDGWLAEISGTLGTYFDGSTTGAGFTYAWTGTANASTSTETVAAGATIAADFTGTGTLTAGLHRNIAVPLSGTGSLTALLTDYQQINAALSSTGTLTAELKNYQRINAPFTGEGSLTAALHRYITAGLSGEGTLTAELIVGATTIDADFTGEGSLTAALHRNISALLSGTGSLTASLTDYQVIDALLTGTGTLTATLTVSTETISANFGAAGYLSATLAYAVPIAVKLSGEGVLLAELVYTPRPIPMELRHLGKLSTYTVTTSAVPSNPAEGSGGTPSINATYIAGVDPEYALGTEHTLEASRAGDYTGEIVAVGVAANSDRVSISMNTLLTLLNAERRVFPYIANASSVDVPAQAVDYMTQACGVLMDAVPGNVVMYASGYGHANGYLQGHEDDRYTSTAKTFAKVSGRYVQSLNGTHVLRQSPAPEELPAFTLTKLQRLVFSTGFILSGSGLTGKVTWNTEDVYGNYVVSLEANSAGTITAKLGSLTLGSFAGASGNVRVTLSIVKTSATTVAAKLTVHDSVGVLVHDGALAVFSYKLPRSLSLTNVTFTGTGMHVYGTYLTVADRHPMTLPAVQKVLGATRRATSFVSGFQDNVWSALNEYASIARMDVRFIEGQLIFEPRITALSHNVPLSTLEISSSRRDKYRRVGIMNQQSKPVNDGTAILWRADSVHQVATREVYETTVSTKHSILDVRNPVCVDGITPFPYKGGAGQYVVTGADGYIVSPAWWNDNGGKIEVSLTDQPGELALKITAPDADAPTRSPYRISEGAGDRPALYICGSGVINDPIQLEIATGATNAKAGFDRVLDSPFVCDNLTVYETAGSMARAYSASVAEVSISEPNDFEAESKFGKYPAGSKFTNGERNFRVISATQNPANTSMEAEPFTTIGELVASFPAGSTIGDMKARYKNRTIREFNIKPLKEG